MSRVLIADDDADLLWIWSETLTDAGYQVETVADGESAREKLSTTQYDLLIADVLMPGDGAIVLAPLARLRQPEIRVLAVTGRLGFEADALETSVPSADRALRKPIGLDDLCRSVGELCSA